MNNYLWLILEEKVFFITNACLGPCQGSMMENLKTLKVFGRVLNTPLNQD